MGAPRLMSWRIPLATCAILAVLLAHRGHGASASATFDNANKAYEQRRFAEAAQLYEEVLSSGTHTASVYFNLGNARYKAGEMGLAIAAYRKAQQLDPRDSDLLANLQFVRGQVSEQPSVPLWRRALRYLTPNEWTALSAVLFWAMFGILAWNQFQPARKFRGAAVALGLITLLCVTATAAAVRDALVLRHGVALNQIPVRFGPLLEAQVAFQLPDGAEIIIVDAKADWLLIRDAAERRGWVRRGDIEPVARHRS